MQMTYFLNSPHGSFVLLSYYFIFVVRCTSACNFSKINTPPWVFFTLFKLYKWYQITKRTTLWENDFLWEIWPQSYPWSSNCLENFGVSVLLVEVPKCWKIAEFLKISIKMKHFKTFYEAHPTSRLKRTKNYYGDIQEYAGICFLIASRMKFLGV